MVAAGGAAEAMYDATAAERTMSERRRLSALLRQR
jgi:hypothetical protein